MKSEFFIIVIGAAGAGKTSFHNEFVKAFRRMTSTLAKEYPKYIVRETSVSARFYDMPLAISRRLVRPNRVMGNSFESVNSEHITGKSLIYTSLNATALMKAVNDHNHSNGRITVNHQNDLPHPLPATTVRSTCSNCCRLRDGVAAVNHQRRGRKIGMYRIHEGFQLQNRIANISCKWRYRFLELIHICETVFLLNRPSTVPVV